MELASDNGITTYTFLNRALQRYCWKCSFEWLTAVNEAAFVVHAGIVEYPLSALGLRSIRMVWVQSLIDGSWFQLDALTTQTYEDSQKVFLSPGQPTSAATTVSGNPQSQQPTGFRISSRNGQLVMYLSPTPDQAYQGRIDGVAETPVIERQRQLPGPPEFHDIVATLAAAYHLKDEAIRVFRQPGAGADAVAKAQGFMTMSKEREAEAERDMDSLVRDSQPNRQISLRYTGIPMAR